MVISDILSIFVVRLGIVPTTTKNYKVMKFNKFYLIAVILFMVSFLILGIVLGDYFTTPKVAAIFCGLSGVVFMQCLAVDLGYWGYLTETGKSYPKYYYETY